MYASLMEGDGYDVNSAAAFVETDITILEDKPKPLAMIVGATEIFEHGMSEMYTITITSEFPHSIPITVPVEVVEGTAKLGDDFIVTPVPENGVTMVVIPLGQTSANLTITPIDNHIFDGDKDFELRVVEGLHNDEGDPSIAGIIIEDNEDLPTVIVSGDEVYEGGEGDNMKAVVKVELDLGASWPIEVSYSTVDGTAVSGVDYEPASGTIVIPPGNLQTGPNDVFEEEIEIEIIGNDLKQPNREFTVEFTIIDAPTDGFDSVEFFNDINFATITILDDDELFEINVTDATIDTGTRIRFDGVIDSGVTGLEDLDYTWELFDQTEAIGGLVDEEQLKQAPMYWDQSTTGTTAGTTQYRVTVVDTGNLDLSNIEEFSLTNDVVDLRGQFGPLMEITSEEGGTTGTIHYGWTLDEHVVLGAGEETVILYGMTQDSGSQLAGVWESRNGESQQIIEGEVLLAAGEYFGEDREHHHLLLTYDSGSEKVYCRQRTGSEGWTINGDGEILELSGYTSSASVVARSGIWYVAASNDNGSESNVKFLRSSGTGWEVIDQTLDLSGRMPSLAVSRDLLVSLAILVQNGNGWDARVYQEQWGLGTGFEQLGVDFQVISGDPGPDPEPDFFDLTADAFGNLWLTTLAEGNTGFYLSKFHAQQEVGGDYEAGAASNSPFNGVNIPVGFDVIPQGVAADHAGWVYFIGTSPTFDGRLALCRAEAVDDSGTGELSLAYDDIFAPSMELSVRQLEGISDSFARVYFDRLGRGTVSWQPALFHENSVYLLGRGIRNRFILEDGLPYTLRDVVYGEWEAEFSGDMEMMIGGSDVLSVHSNGTSITLNSWVPAALLSELVVQITEAPHGWQGDLGRKFVNIRLRLDGEELWPVRDSIVYATWEDAIVEGMRITDGGPPSPGHPFPIAANQVLVDANGYRQFGVRFTYSPNLPFNLGPGDVDWTVTGGVGAVESSGIFTPHGLGGGKLTASHDLSGVSDSLHVIVDNEGGVAYFDIYPEGETILGLSEEISLRAVGRNIAGQRVPTASPTWRVEGSGRVTQDGHYFSPDSGNATGATIIVEDRNEALAQGRKQIHIDSVPPHVLNFSVEAAIKGEGTVGGRLDFSWELRKHPPEISMPVTYQLLINDLDLIGVPFTSDGTTTETLNYSFESHLLSNSTHTFTLLAADARGNSNRAKAPSIVLEIDNSIDSLGMSRGLDWLLRHQYRDSADAEFFGSWKNSFNRGKEELVLEAAMVTRILASLDLSYRSSGELGRNIHSGEHVSVALAYHDAVAFLARSVSDDSRSLSFATRAAATEALSGAARHSTRIEDIAREPSSTFRRSEQLVDRFVRDEIVTSDFTNRLTGGLFSGEESRPTRYETHLALRVLISSGRINELEHLLGIPGKEEGSWPVYDFFARNLSLEWRGNDVRERTEINEAGWANQRHAQAHSGGIRSVGGTLIDDLYPS
ncbi:MAG: hypothetical protein JJU11_18565, partial [Candidatus Sumerlaeia bacterium]|nr:hypothetical protein [Candidatus Sumerlaeia bacterium]